MRATPRRFLRRSFIAAHEDGSSLPELLVATGLTLVALSMLATTVLSPLAVLVRTGAPNARQAELERAGDEAAAALRLARPGIGQGPIVLAAAQRIEIRDGSLTIPSSTVLQFIDGALLIERPDGRPTRVLVSGLDPAASRFIIHGPEGQDLSDASASSPPVDAAVVTVRLSDSEAPDGSTGGTVIRSVRLPFRLPLAMGRPG
jgi:hypothetical protein